MMWYKVTSTSCSLPILSSQRAQLSPQVDALNTIFGRLRTSSSVLTPPDSSSGGDRAQLFAYDVVGTDEL